MTRQEYRDLVIREFSIIAVSLIYGWSFPELLKDVAARLFYRNDITSELARETKRRLHQLYTTGITDP